MSIQGKENPAFLEQYRNWTVGDEILHPDLAHKIATEMVEKDPNSLQTVIFWRWEMELKRGIVNFDPRNPDSYQQVKIGSYVKRIIPDRIQPKTEKFSDPNIPVFLPFGHNFINNFDFSMAKPGQKLLSIQVENDWFDVFASNSPLAQVPHTLLVPREPRSQFLLPIDLKVVSVLRERYPSFHFVYSSMGGGAGVNHQHWHMMAGQAEYPVLERPIEQLIQGRRSNVGHYPRFPTDCFVIESHDGYQMDTEVDFVNLLQQTNTPHNLYVQQNRTWIAPRSHTETSLIPGKKYGAWETVLGVCNTGSQEQYDCVNETVLKQALREIQLKPEEKEKLAQELKSLA
jgi:hypothetical protein